MKKTEIIFVILLITGLILKSNVITGGNTLYVFSTLILGLIYFPFGFLYFNNIPIKYTFSSDSYKDIKKFVILNSIIMGISILAISIAILLKIQRYGVYDIVFWTGFLLGVISLILLAKNRRLSKKGNSKVLLLRLVAYMIFGIAIYSWKGSDMMKFQYRNNKDYLEAYSAYIENPQNEMNRIRYNVEDLRLIYLDWELKQHLEKNTDFLHEIMTEKEIEYYRNKYGNK